MGLRRDIRGEARTTAAVCELVAALDAVSIVPIPGPDLAADARLSLLALSDAPESEIRLLRPRGASSRLAQAFWSYAGADSLDFGRYVRPDGRRGLRPATGR
jgi:hypothetical protein